MNRKDTDQKPYDNEVTSTHKHLFAGKKHLFIFRIICTIYFTVEFILFFTWQGAISRPVLFLYLTNWGVITTYLYFLFVTFDYIFNMKLEKTCRLLNFMNFVVELFIFIFAWSIIVPNVIKKWDTLGPPARWNNIVWHTTPMLSLLIDTAWNQHLYYLKHGWVPTLYLVIYAIVNATYS